MPGCPARASSAFTSLLKVAAFSLSIRGQKIGRIWRACDRPCACRHGRCLTHLPGAATSAAAARQCTRASSSRGRPMASISALLPALKTLSPPTSGPAPRCAARCSMLPLFHGTPVVLHKQQHVVWLPASRVSPMAAETCSPAAAKFFKQFHAVINTEPKLAENLKACREYCRACTGVCDWPLTGGLAGQPGGL